MKGWFRGCMVLVFLIGAIFVTHSPAFSQEGDLRLSKEASPIFLAALKNSRNSLSSSEIAISPGIPEQPSMMAAVASEGANVSTEKLAEAGVLETAQIGRPTMGVTCTTCSPTCRQTCQTCGQQTCGATCAQTCAATCAQTCAATCGATCAQTCTGATCGQTCLGAATCGGYTCQSVTCGGFKTCFGPGCKPSPSR
jgi:hypothetical protein